MTRLHGKIEAKIQTWIAFVLTVGTREHSFMNFAFSIVVLFILLDCVTNEKQPCAKGCHVPLTAFYRPVKALLSTLNAKTFEVVFLPLHWQQATQILWSWQDYPWKSCTADIHDMITLSVLDVIVAFMKSQALISKIHCMLLANQKRVREFKV